MDVWRNPAMLDWDYFDTQLRSKPLRHLGPILTSYKRTPITMFLCRNTPNQLEINTSASVEKLSERTVVRTCVGFVPESPLGHCCRNLMSYCPSAAPDGPIQQLLQLQNSATWGYTKIHNCTYQQREGKAAVSQEHARCTSFSCSLSPSLHFCSLSCKK